MVAERSDERVGSVEEEAARLVASLRRMSVGADDDGLADTVDDGTLTESADDDGLADGAAPRRPTSPSAAASPDEAWSGLETSVPSGAAENPDGGLPPHDPACRWCPVCRSVAAVRQVSPETLSRLADLAALAATVLTDLAGQRADARTAAGPPTGSPVADDPGRAGDPRRADDMDGEPDRG
ncbi:MAG: hypothetical protein ACRCZP_02880 [Phycicoccus sp.]